MEKIKIYYHKNTKEFKGAGNISKINDGNGNFMMEHPVEEYSFVEIDFKDWIAFWKQNVLNKQIYIEDGKLKSEDIVKTLDEIRRQKTGQRKKYLKDTYEIWFDDVENMPQEIKEKRNLAKQEIKKIESATQKTINNYSINF